MKRPEKVVANVGPWVGYADELEKELSMFREGYKGGCYACELVGELNVKLVARIDALEKELWALREDKPFQLLQARNQKLEKEYTCYCPSCAVKLQVTPTKIAREVDDEPTAEERIEHKLPSKEDYHEKTDAQGLQPQTTHNRATGVEEKS